MNEQGREHIFESERTRHSSAMPAVESLFTPEQAEWTKDIAENEDYRKQMESRTELIQRLDEVIAALPRPDVSLQAATSEGKLSESQAADFYESISELLEDGEDYRRVILYLPFEILPDARWQPPSPRLKKEVERFRVAYMAAWNGLLAVHDVRANFVDGDVLETESRTGDLPRVVKAAHLIPRLAEKGLLDMQKVLKLMNDSGDEILEKSIADTLPVLADLGLLDKAKLEGTQALQSNTRASSPEPDAITEKRKAWLKEEEKRKAIETAGDDIATAIKIDPEESSSQLTKPDEPESQQALVNGIRKAVEGAAAANLEQAKKIYGKYAKLLIDLHAQNLPGVSEELDKTFCRLHGLGLIEDRLLDKLGLSIPKLTGPFSENLRTLEEELSNVREITAALENDPEARQWLYPVALVFGSRLKGYGGKNADLDLAVFVKPETAETDKKKVRSALNRATAGKTEGGAVEFWLERTANGLRVRTFDDYDPMIGERFWTHILFGAAWEGNRDAINGLQKQVLTAYLYESNEEKIHGLGARRLFLEELERDSIQYRLMHKGYDKFFPRLGGLNTPHAGRVDGSSAFWDSGFRQVATKLFLSRVFLPKLSK